MSRTSFNIRWPSCSLLGTRASIKILRNHLFRSDFVEFNFEEEEAEELLDDDSSVDDDNENDGTWT